MFGIAVMHPLRVDVMALSDMMQDCRTVMDVLLASLKKNDRDIP